LGIQGGCNVQLALNPNGSDYYVIEVNPRVSRSSALASKATGYPIARIAAKIAIGLRLDEIRNPITGTSAAFEPALDYCVVKIPRFPFDKFPTGDRTLGTQMKATGEVMAIDRTFEGALMKAVRGLEAGVSDLRYPPAARLSPMELETLIATPNDMRLFYIAEAFRRGWLVEEVHGLCKIDPWFLHRIRRLVEMEQELIARSGEVREVLLEGTDVGANGRSPLHTSSLHTAPLPASSLLRRAKEWQFGDKFLAQITGLSEAQVREGRKALGILPAFKMVDTCAGEFEAHTPYFYSTYHGVSDRPAPKHPRKALVLGSGPIRIGQGIEFDYSAVHAVRTLREMGYYAMILNNNPETVSTDFDISDALYFDPIATEDVLNLLEYEAGDSGEPVPVLVQFGGQTAINLVKSLQAFGVPILGTPPESIELAEDRRQFDALLERLGVPRPPGRAVLTLEEARETAHAVGYPVLVRPSYVLGGRAMEIVRTDAELETYWRSAVLAFPDAPVLVDKYIEGKEAEVDLIGDGERFLIPAVMEHIERAGVHSGDSMAVVPPRTLTESEQAQIRDYSLRLARALRACGLLNIQFVVQDGQVYVIEVNPRASRTVPYLSKITDIPMVRWAVAAQLGQPLPLVEMPPDPTRGRIAVKAPVFSHLKLRQVEVALGPEMRSTGEVMGIDCTYEAALYKAMVAAGIKIPRTGAVLLTLADKDKAEGVQLARAFLAKGFQLLATRGTAAALQAAGLPVQVVPKIGEGSPNLLDYIKGKRVQLLVNTPSPERRAEQQGLLIRRAAVESGVPCLTALDTAWALLRALDAADWQVHPIGQVGYAAVSPTAAPAVPQ
jgi:carbamoyl-phosphate synthase large subunit